MSEMIEIVRSDWSDIKSAPKDGSIVWVRNRLTHDRKISAQFTHYESPFGSTSKQWIVVREYGGFMPSPSGTLIVPDEWTSREPT